MYGLVEAWQVFEPHRHSKAALGVHEMLGNDRSAWYRRMAVAEPAVGSNAADVDSSDVNCIETNAEKPDYPLPLSIFNLRNESKISFIENVEKMEDGAEVILVLLGVEGFNANVEGLRA